MFLLRSQARREVEILLWSLTVVTTILGCAPEFTPVRGTPWSISESRTGEIYISIMNLAAAKAVIGSMSIYPNARTNDVQKLDERVSTRFMESFRLVYRLRGNSVDDARPTGWR